MLLRLVVFSFFLGIPVAFAQDDDGPDRRARSDASDFSDDDDSEQRGKGGGRGMIDVKAKKGAKKGKDVVKTSIPQPGDIIIDEKGNMVVVGNGDSAPKQGLKLGVTDTSASIKVGGEETQNTPQRKAKEPTTPSGMLMVTEDDSDFQETPKKIVARPQSDWQDAEPEKNAPSNFDVQVTVTPTKSTSQIKVEEINTQDTSSSFIQTGTPDDPPVEKKTQKKKPSKKQTALEVEQEQEFAQADDETAELRVL